MIFKVGGVDYSNKVEVTGYKVTPRKVIGTSAGDLLSGDHIADVLKLKTDLEVTIVATEEADTSAIAYACSGEYVNLEFTDPITATALSGVYEPSIGGIEMAIDQDAISGNGKRYWYGFTITFSEK